MTGGDGSVWKKFQSTLPRRERRVTSVTVQAALEISIHAPEKGATA